MQDVVCIIWYVLNSFMIWIVPPLIISSKIEADKVETLYIKLKILYTICYEMYNVTKKSHARPLITCIDPY